MKYTKRIQNKHKEHEMNVSQRINKRERKNKHIRTHKMNT